MKQNFSLLDGCVLQPDPGEDPCLEFWEDDSRLNAYSFGGAVEAIISQSTDSSEPDIMTYWEPAYFPGFVRGNVDSQYNDWQDGESLTWTYPEGFPEEFIDNKNAVTAVHLKVIW